MTASPTSACKCGHIKICHGSKDGTSLICSSPECDCDFFQSCAPAKEDHCSGCTKKSWDFPEGRTHQSGTVEHPVISFLREKLASIEKAAGDRAYQEASEKAGHHFLYEVIPAERAQARTEALEELRPLRFTDKRKYDVVFWKDVVKALSTPPKENQ